MEDSTWLTRLRHYLLTADERAVFRANPRALAAQLGLAERETLKRLARAASERLVELEWDVHCPRCQAEACRVSHVRDLPKDVDCDFCGHDYDVHVDHEVWVTYTVRPEVRRLSDHADDPGYRRKVDATYGPLNALALLNLPLFRALFTGQVLPEAASLRVRQVTILATDLRGSTTLYAHAGDVAAHQFVRDHFRVIFAAAEAHEGLAVKTLGDGVMAAFPTTLDGLRAAVEIQRGMTAFLREHNGLGDGQLALRVGLHTGPSILVTMNGQLDFFGATVNIAFRVARLSHGGDILVTDTALDPAARRELETLGPAETFHTVLKGFEDDCLIHRLNSLDRPASA
jgi:class 3 adenylate cyclase